jgi:hypothetical protein
VHIVGLIMGMPLDEILVGYCVNVVKMGNCI